MTFNNIILTMAVNDSNGAEESTDPSELIDKRYIGSVLDKRNIASLMDKRNIASVAREFYGSYKPGSRYDSKVLLCLPTSTKT